MSTPVPDYYLLLPVRLGGVNLRPGTALFSAQDPIAQIQAAAPNCTWPASDALVAAAAVECQAQLRRGVNDGELSARMLAAAAASARAAGWQELSATISFADFAALAVGVKTKDYLLTGVTLPAGGALPAGARNAVGPIAEGWTGFDDLTHAVVDLTVGTALGGTQLAASTAVDVTTGSGFPQSIAAAGAAPGLAVSGTVSARITSAVDLKTLTAGALQVKYFYSIQP